jgi:GNAT superfamily N-acetyltransferase
MIESNSLAGSLNSTTGSGAVPAKMRNIARIFVATDDDLGVIGFYSLSSFTLAIGDLPEEVGSKLPRYDAIPAAPIGRLARDIRARGRGIGELLLADAVRRILGASQSVAVFAIVVEAKDAAASVFYQGFGFRPFPLRPQATVSVGLDSGGGFRKDIGVGTPAENLNQDLMQPLVLGPQRRPCA